MKKLYIICNSHLDPVWLWNLSCGRSAWINTVHSVVRIFVLLDGFRPFMFAGGLLISFLHLRLGLLHLPGGFLLRLGKLLLGGLLL